MTSVVVLLLILTTVACQDTNYLMDIFNIVNHRQFDYIPTIRSRVAEKDVTFYLLTRQNPETPKEINVQNLQEADVSKPFKFLIHGWTESAQAQWYKDAARAYLMREDCNVVQTDWSGPASAHYRSSVSYTRTVGEIIGHLIVELKQRHGLSLKDVALVGHSLGAHVAGFAGKEIIRSTGKKIARISGLDPAGPLFEDIFSSKTDRLCDEDAEMVDVTHTDGGIFGFRYPLGTVDFFPNGGVPLQPGCRLFDILGILVGSSDGAFCSHARSYIYFIESIGSDDFLARRCHTWDDFQRGLCNDNEVAVYGDSTLPNVRGNYYFRTNSAPPFARGFEP